MSLPRRGTSLVRLVAVDAATPMPKRRRLTVDWRKLSGVFLKGRKGKGVSEFVDLIH